MILRLCVVCLCVSAVAHSARSDVLHVDASAGPGGDGSNWVQAFDSLTDALAVAQPFDQIWITAGVYVPDSPGGRDATFTIPDGVAVFGGFVGDEDVLAQRPSDPLADPTVLSGGRLDPWSVVTMPNVGMATTLDGLIVNGGRADGTGPLNRRNGGGVFAIESTPTFRNVVFSRGFATEFGGGLYVNSSSTVGVVTIEDCAFGGCEAGTGGGMASLTAVNVRRSDFAGNSAQSRGGGAAVFGDRRVTIEDSVFEENTALGTSGGGLVVEMTGSAAEVVVTRSVFDRNTARFSGGGLLVAGEGDVVMRESRISRNTLDPAGSSIGGGAIVGMDTGSSFWMENCLVAGNFAQSGSGGLAFSGDTSAFVLNTTVVGNRTLGIVAGLSALGGDLVVSNSIIWDNIAEQPSSPTRSISIGGSASNANGFVENSLVEFWFDGSGPLAGSAVTDADPMMIDADGPDNTFGSDDDNVRLMPGSPAIDTGNQASASVLSGFDYYGDFRFRDDTGTPGIAPGLIIDIGAAEFQGTSPPPCLADTNGDGVLTPGDFNAWILAFNNQSPACDQNGDGACTPGDFNAWILNFNAGC
ncbi:MAG: right-handed parallel beta-helix repeat-containing protein [Planctomycetota bacterium]